MPETPSITTKIKCPDCGKSYLAYPNQLQCAHCYAQQQLSRSVSPTPRPDSTGSYPISKRPWHIIPLGPSLPQDPSAIAPSYNIIDNNGNPVALDIQHNDALFILQAVNNYRKILDIP